MGVPMLELIRRKRLGGEHTAEEIAAIVDGAVAGAIPEYQLAAWLMAVCWRGLSYGETLALTRAFVASGDVLRWPGLPGPVVDKHSTGGVGDKVSLVLAPWLAELGLYVPKMSGRGLGHTGGTIDKLESIPGLRTTLSLTEMRAVLAGAGCVIAGQSDRLAPADKLFYALRDATDTVDSPGLIAASIMSKKVALGASCAVLDVKCGSGAFLPDAGQARQFAELVMHLGADCGLPVACVLTRMDEPLGQAVGNALEVVEAWRFLAGELDLPDLREVCESLGAAALVLCERCSSIGEGTRLMREAWRSGLVGDRFERWIGLQQGSIPVFLEWLAQDQDHAWVEVVADRSGRVMAMDVRAIGELSRELGAGRLAKDAGIDHAVGLQCLAKLGAAVREGQAVARLRLQQAHLSRAATFAGEYLAALSIGEGSCAPGNVVLDVLLR
jgi:pyrimidine-nucleoside phosphorylase